jgi:radical SAM superfamily enzyme YgiQ (UPF0313 family)
MQMPVSAVADAHGVRHIHRGDGASVLLIKPTFHFYPIGLAYVASALREAGIGYDVVDLSVVPRPNWPAILKANRYVAAASGGLFGDYLEFARVFSDIHQAAPQLPLLLGGPITWNVDADLLLDHVPANMLVIGEGEVTLPETIRRLAEGGQHFEDIPGLVWRDSHGATTRSPRRKAIDLRAKTFLPDWDIIDQRFYRFSFIPVLTGRGCTGTCSFCSPTNGRFRSRSVDDIIEEIERENATYAFDAFAFLNEILFPDAQTTLEFCSRYERLRPRKAFSCLLRCDFPVEALPRLREAGCVLVHVGMESGSDKVLAAMGKRTSADMVRKFMVAAREVRGLSVRSSIMFGNYQETAEDIDATIDLACEIGVRQNTALVLNYPGTLNYRRARERGLVSSEHEYLVNMTKLTGLAPCHTTSKVRNGEASYPNISELDTAALLEKTEAALRRYHTQVYRGKVCRAEVREGTKLEVTVQCPFCGAETDRVLDATRHSPLDMEWTCACGVDEQRPTYFSAFDLPVYGPHLRTCVGLFEQAKRVAVLTSGDQKKADAFLWADRIGLSLDKVCAFVATPALPEGYVSNHRVLPLAEVQALRPDLYVAPDGLPRSLLRVLYGPSLAWELPEPWLCSTSVVRKFRQHLGAELVHGLPAAAQAMRGDSLGPRYFLSEGLRLPRLLAGSVASREIGGMLRQVWDTPGRRRLLPDGSRRVATVKRLRDLVSSRLSGRTS